MGKTIKYALVKRVPNKKDIREMDDLLDWSQVYAPFYSQMEMSSVPYISSDELSEEYLTCPLANVLGSMFIQLISLRSRYRTETQESKYSPSIPSPCTLSPSFGERRRAFADSDSDSDYGSDSGALSDSESNDPTHHSDPIKINDPETKPLSSESEPLAHVSNVSQRKIIRSIVHFIDVLDQMICEDCGKSKIYQHVKHCVLPTDTFSIRCPDGCDEKSGKSLHVGKVELPSGMIIQSLFGNHAGTGGHYLSQTFRRGDYLMVLSHTLDLMGMCIGLKKDNPVLSRAQVSGPGQGHADPDPFVLHTCTNILRQVPEYQKNVHLIVCVNH